MIFRFLKKYRFLFLRRFTQISIILLYLAGNVWGWSFLQGNLSSSLLMGTIPLSDPYAVLQMLFAGAIVSGNLIVGAVIIAIFYALLGGRIFCSWVCPINPITDLASFVRQKLGFNKVQKKQPATRSIKYWVLGLSLIISFALGITAFEFISPISMVHRGLVFGLGFGLSAMIVIFLFDLLVLKNGWCGHICPLGGFYSLIGKFSLIRVNHDSESCTNCMKCKEVCPEMQVLWMINKKSVQILNTDCTNCGRCIEVCDDNSLNFSIKKLVKDK